MGCNAVDRAAGDNQGFTLGYVSVWREVGDRVQRSNPLWRIEREFLFEGDMSYVAMGTGGQNPALCELQLRPEEKVRLKGSHTTPLNHKINQHRGRSGFLVWRISSTLNYQTNIKTLT